MDEDFYPFEAFDFSRRRFTLVDTGLPAEAKDMEPTEKTQIFTGKTTTPYVEGFKALGYKPEQVTKILVTHKHPDHTGELRAFPNAKIYIGPEDADALKLKEQSDCLSLNSHSRSYCSP